MNPKDKLSLDARGLWILARFALQLWTVAAVAGAIAGTIF